MVFSIFGFVPMKVDAATTETAGNETQLEDALTNVDDGGTITLTASFTYNNTFAINEKSVIMNLNGNELTIDASSIDNAIEVMNGGSLIVKNGVINATSHPNCTGILVQPGTLICESDCTINTTGGEYGIFVLDGGIATINGNVSAAGEESSCICASGVNSKITLNGNVGASGTGSLGAMTMYGGSIIINGEVETNGTFSRGVYSTGAGSIITATGNINVNGDSSQGVATFDNGIVTVTGDVTVIGNRGEYFNTYGVRGLTFGEATIKGNVTVNGDYGIGVDAKNSGLVTINGNLTANGKEVVGAETGIGSWYIGDTAGGTVYINGTITTTGLDPVYIITNGVRHTQTPYPPTTLKNNISYYAYVSFGTTSGYVYVEVPNYEKPEQTVVAKQPTADKKPATYTGNVSVKLTSATDGAKIYYTLDGNAPTTNSNYVSNGGTVKISRTSTLKAMAVKPGNTNSSVFSGKYSIKTNKPTVKNVPKSKTVKKGKKITLKAPAGTTLYFTTNGKVPTTKLKTKVNAGKSKKITVNKKTTLKVIAVKKGCIKSSVVKRTYKIK